MNGSQRCLLNPYFIIFAMIGFLHLPLAAEEPNHSPEFITTEFTRGYNLSDLRENLVIDRALSGSGALSIQQVMNVTLFESSGFQNQWRLDEHVRFDLRKPVTDKMQWTIGGEHERFIDEPVAGLGDRSALPSTDIHYNHIGTGVFYNVRDFGNAYAGAGPVLENRSGNSQFGTRYKYSLEGTDSFQGLKTSGWIDDLPASNNYALQAAYDNIWSLSDDVRDRMNVSWSNRGQRERSTPGSDLNKRLDEEFRISNILQTSEQNPWQLSWQSNLTRLRTTHLTDRSDLSDFDFIWDNSANLNWRMSNWHGFARSAVKLQEQQYAGSLTQGRTTLIELRITSALSETDSITFESYATGYRYDTPDESDFNDRDELRYHVAIGGAWRITDELGFRTRLESNLRHLVYIFKYRSRENRWLRLFRLSMEIPWDAGFVVNRARFAVLSNYTDYDYILGEDDPSRVYRSFTAHDTLDLKLSDNAGVQLYMTGILDDHGHLRWSEWIEDLSEEGSGFSIAALPGWKMKSLRLNAGWSWNSWRTKIYLASGRTSDAEKVISNGPLFHCRYFAGNRFTAELSGKVLTVRDRQRGGYTLNDIRFKLNYAL